MPPPLKSSCGAGRADTSPNEWAEVRDDHRRAAITEVGEPTLPAWADAARRAVCDALTGVGAVMDVCAALDDGSVQVAVTIDATADVSAVHAVLDGHAISSEVKER